MGAVLLLLAGTHHEAAAHVNSIGYSHITVDGDHVNWQLYLDPFHLDTFILMDEDHDGVIGAPEVAAEAQAIREMVQPHLQAMDVETGEKPAATVGDISLVEMGDTGLSGDHFTDLQDFPLVSVPVSFEFTDLASKDLLLTYGLFLEVGFGDHNNTARIDVGDRSTDVVFELEEPAILVGDLPGVGSQQSGGADRTWMLAPALGLLALAGVLTTLLVRHRRATAGGPGPAPSAATSTSRHTRTRPRGATR